MQRALKLSLMTLTAAIVSAVVACAPNNKVQKFDVPQESNRELTGGANSKGILYTSTSAQVSDLLERYKQVIPATPENVKLAQRQQVEVRFLDAQNKEVPSAKQASLLEVFVFLFDDNNKVTKRLDYYVPMSALNKKIISLIPRDQTSRNFDASIQCEDDFCVDFTVRLLEYTPLPPPTSADPSTAPQSTPPPLVRPPQAPQPNTQPLPSAPQRTESPTTSPAAPSAPSTRVPPPKPGPATVTPGRKPDAPPIAETATIVTVSDAEMRFLFPVPSKPLLEPALLGKYPEIMFIRQNYMDEENPNEGTLTLLANVKRTSVVRGRSRVSVRIPFGTDALCLDIDMLETQNQASEVFVRCGSNLFESALLAGNSNDGMVALILKHRSKMDVVLQLNLTPEQSERQATPTPVNPVQVIEATELAKVVNAHAFMKLDLSRPRTREMEAQLEGEVLRPEQEKQLKDREKVVLGNEGNRRILAAFLASPRPLDPKVQSFYADFDIPVNLMLLTIKESGPFWTSGTIQVSRVSDCPAGPFQIKFGTAKDTAEGVLNLKFGQYRLLSPANGGCEPSRLKDELDDRTDFVKAARLSAGYLKKMADMFATARLKSTGAVDSRILLAAYNAGPRRMEEFLQLATSTDTKNPQLANSTARVDRALSRENGDYYRLFVLADVFPDFWRLQKLNIFKSETKNYVLDWMILRRVNQDPTKYGFETAQVSAQTKP